jgi:hypothetical protein
MFARSLLMRHKLYLDPHRGLPPSFGPIGRRVTGIEIRRISMQSRRNVRTESTGSTKPVASSAQVDESSQVDDIHPSETGDPINREPDAGQAGGEAQPERKRTHQFDTYRLVLALQSAGYSRPQAIALMKCLRTVLINGTEFAKSHYLSRGDLENVRRL